MLSHSTKLVGSLYLFVGGYVKIRVHNFVYWAYGLIGVFLVGISMNGLFAIFGLPDPNSMYLTGTALEGVPLFTGYFLGVALSVVLIIITITWEFFVVEKGYRWYNQISKNYKKLKLSNKNI